MDRFIGELPPSQDNLYYGYHAADPTPLDPLFTHLNPKIDCGFFFYGGCIWRDDCLSCRSIPAIGSGPESTVNGPTPASLNRMAANLVSHQPLLGDIISNEQTPVSHRKACTGKVPTQGAPVRCDWQGCSYTDSFKREADLIRHRQCLHIAPGRHTCPVKGCTKVCNRQDNLHTHMRNVHRFEWTCSRQKKGAGRTQPPAAPLQCKWKGCYHLDVFKCESELFEHIRNAHITREETAFYPMDGGIAHSIGTASYYSP